MDASCPAGGSDLLLPKADDLAAFALAKSTALPDDAETGESETAADIDGGGGGSTNTVTNL